MTEVERNQRTLTIQLQATMSHHVPPCPTMAHHVPARGRSHPKPQPLHQFRCQWLSTASSHWRSLHPWSVAVASSHRCTCRSESRRRRECRGTWYQPKQGGWCGGLNNKPSWSCCLWSTFTCVCTLLGITVDTPKSLTIIGDMRYHIYIDERRSRKWWNMIALGPQENLGGPLCHTESYFYTWLDKKNYLSPTGIIPYNIRI